MCIFKKKSIESSLESQCLNEYLWVKKVFDSCETILQLLSASNLIHLFYKKWNLKIDPLYVNNLKRNLDDYWFVVEPGLHGWNSTSFRESENHL